MRDSKKTTTLILILIFIFSATAAVGAQGRINNMNFKNAELVDVLRAIAEVADVNLITDSTVSGTVTVHLKDISFKKALDLITQTRSLTYKWDENTVVVAPPDRIDVIYADIVTEFIPINSNDMDSISVIVKDIFPETQITVDSVRRQFILKGERAVVSEIKEMINRLDSSAVVQEKEEKKFAQADAGISEEEEKIYAESYQLLNAEMSDLRDKINQVNDKLQVKGNPLTNTLTISGKESGVKEAISMASTYDQSLEPETRIVRVDYVDTEQITAIVGKFYPNIKIHLNQKRKEIIINGAKNKLDGVVQLVKEINKPQQQVIIEARLEEISTDRLKELGIDLSDSRLSRIHFIKDKSDPSTNNPGSSEFGQIEGIELTWPNFFRAIEDDSLSKTLANPRLMTLNGEEANMSIVDEVPYPVYDDEGNQSYDYMQAGIDLTFTPWITENNEIELKITPEVSSFGARPEGAALPPKKTRSVDTRLRLKDGETFAIGGLIQEDEAESMSKIPLLGDLPIIGELFKSRSDEGSRSELIIFVTPRIINYGEEMPREEHLIDSGLKAEAEANEVETEAEVNVNEENTVAEANSNPDNQVEAASDTDTLAESDITSQNTNFNEIDENQNKAKSREEILAKYKNDEEKEFNELTSEELQEILNKN